MKILHIYSGNLFGGVETALITLTKHENEIPDLRQSFALCFDERLSASLKQLPSPSVHILGRVKIRLPWTIIRARQKLKNILAQGQYDFAICHGAWSLGLFGSLIGRTPTQLAFWAHDPFSGTGMIERLATRTKPKTTISNSQATHRDVTHWFKPLNAFVLHNPVEPPMTWTPEERRACRKQLNIQDNAVVITQVSRMERWKGQEILIDSLKLLTTDQPWIALIVGGPQRKHEFEYFRELNEKVEHLGLRDRIKFLGDRSDVSQILNASDIFVQPNLKSEPFGIVFIEAMYHRLPIVTAASGGASEILTDQNAILLPSITPTVVSAALSQLIENAETRTKLGASGPGQAKIISSPKQQLIALTNYLNQSKNPVSTEARAQMSLGQSDRQIYQKVAQIIQASTHNTIESLIDVGCGKGAFREYLYETPKTYVGLDLVEHPDLRAVINNNSKNRVQFYKVNLDQTPYELPPLKQFDIVSSIETIEHLENPRAFIRELLKLSKPGGLIIVTTPNQLSLLSKFTFLIKSQFNAFQDGSYPAHITALLKSDLIKIAKENGLKNIQIHYSGSGRIPFTSKHYPSKLSHIFKQLLSDNIILSCNTPTLDSNPQSKEMTPRKDSCLNHSIPSETTQ